MWFGSRRDRWEAPTGTSNQRVDLSKALHNRIEARLDRFLIRHITTESYRGYFARLDIAVVD